jgi:phosphopantetheinyl transferase
LNGAPNKRRFDWLMGRVAAKDALRLLLRDQMGLVLCPADIEITPDGRGRPEVGGTWLNQVAHRPIVSIAHSGHVAMGLAAANSMALGVGIDFEPADAVRPEAEQVAFTQPERQWLSSVSEREWATRLWCAKEAVGKAIGRGLNGNPCDLEMQEVDRTSGMVVVKLRDRLAREVPELADHALVAQTVCEDKWVIATALI